MLVKLGKRAWLRDKSRTSSLRQHRLDMMREKPGI
jgi:hypothetical protein